jgi:hypothetical protein
MTTTLLLAFLCGVVVGVACAGYPLYAMYKGAEVARKNMATRYAAQAAQYVGEIRAARRTSSWKAK